MKKRIIALLGTGIFLLSACATAYSKDDAKNVYKDKSETFYATKVQDTYTHNPEAELVKENEEALNGYILKYVTDLTDEDNIKAHTVHKYDSLDVLPSADANFNARVDAEEEWAKKYGEEFTYEIDEGKVTASLAASKTVTSDEDKEAGYSVGYAFSYIALYNKEGLLESSKLTIAIVKTNNKDSKDVAKYQVTSQMSATWKDII